MLPSLFPHNSGPSIEVDSHSLAAVLPTALPAEHDYLSDVRMATVRSVSALFLYLLDSVKQNSSSASVTDVLRLLQPASAILLSACPVSCYDLLVTYLQSSIVNVSSAQTSVLTLTDVEMIDSQQFCSLLPDVILVPVRAVARHPNIARLKEMTAAVDTVCG